MRISFIIPSRNNLKYLKNAIASIEEYYNNQHDIVLLDDASTDGTWEWIQSLKGDHIVKYRNEGPERVGHIPLYNLGAKLCKTEIFTVFHADMIITENFVNNVIKHLKRKTAVSSTRIEPPLHPPGPEKFVRMYGFEPEEFQRDLFLEEVRKLEISEKNRTTNGMFVPWTMHREDFLAIGGFDDELFAPMELDDSDLANRLYLGGYTLVQSRDSFVYHMTCRGSRFKDGIEIEAEIPLPDGTTWYKPKDSEEYKALRATKFREWWRKWGSNVLHDELLMPKVLPKYNIAFIAKHCNLQMLELFEPWCDRIYIEDSMQILTNNYIEKEQPNTKFDLSKRVLTLEYNNPQEENDIVVEFDARQVTQQSFNIIQQLSEIIQQSGEVGQFELDIFKITIHSMIEYQNELIVCKN